GQRAVVIDADDAAESTAGRASSHRIVEAEERWRGVPIFDVTLRAMETVGEMVDHKCSFVRPCPPPLLFWRRGLGRGGPFITPALHFRVFFRDVQFANCQFSFAEMIRLFTGLDEPGTVGRGWAQPILDHGEALGGRMVRRET